MVAAYPTSSRMISPAAHQHRRTTFIKNTPASSSRNPILLSGDENTWRASLRTQVNFCAKHPDSVGRSPTRSRHSLCCEDLVCLPCCRTGSRKTEDALHGRCARLRLSRDDDQPVSSYRLNYRIDATTCIRWPSVHRSTCADRQ